MDRDVPKATDGQSPGAVATEEMSGKNLQEIQYETTMINMLGMVAAGVREWTVVIITKLIQENIIQTQTGEKNALLHMKEVPQRKDGGHWRMMTNTNIHLNQRTHIDRSRKNTHKGTGNLNGLCQSKRDTAAGKHQKIPDIVITKMNLTTVSTKRTLTTDQ